VLIFQPLADGGKNRVFVTVCGTVADNVLTFSLYVKWFLRGENGAGVLAGAAVCGLKKSASGTMLSA
jgi:hypothetical protein